MNDLDTAIRATLDAWAPVKPPPGYPGPEFTATTDDHLTPDQREQWRARWEQLTGAPPAGAVHILYSGLLYLGFDEMRAAILAALDVHKPEWHGSKRICWHCVYPMGGDNVDWPCETTIAIAKALGIEVGGG